MGSPYTGDPTNFPSAITIPDDSDPPNMSTFNPAIEGMEDQIQSIAQHGLMELMRQEFLDDGTWNKPDDLASDIIWVDICGGGGGGGFGGLSGMTNGPNLFNSGGAGGGAALWQRIPIDVSTLAVGDAVNLGIGAGGAGSSVAGDPGADGDSSSIDIPVLYPDGTWFARGGAGGAPGRATNDSNRIEAALGGPPQAGARFAKWWRPPTAVADLPPPLLQPSQGGHACVTTFPAFTTAGADSPTWLNGTSSAGGSAGSAGAVDGTYNGGGPGGGGGGGPFGAGGQGGNGGAGNASGNGGNATNGGNALVNSGAGGGGGGGAGYGSGTLGTNGHGGNGGKGRGYVYWWKKGRVLP